MGRGDNSFKVLAKVGANAYKLELPGDMAVSATFNMGELNPYEEDDIDFGDLRESPFKRGDDDVSSSLIEDSQPG